MKKAKKIRRFIPCSLFDISKLENWLEDMAADGFILQSLSNQGIATFKEAEPRTLRYRVWLKNKFKDEGDAKRLRESYGFVRIEENTNLDIYITDSNTGNSIDNDEEAQLLHQKAIKHQIKLSVFQILFSVAAMALYFFIKPFFLTTVVFGTAFSLVPVLLLVFAFVEHIARIISISKIKHRESGLNEKCDWRIGSTVNTIIKICETLLTVILLPLLIGLNYNILIASHISSCSEELPFATVENLFPDAEYVISDRYERNTYTHWNIAASPVNYEWNEDATVTLPDGSVYDCYFKVNYHETANSFIAKGVARDYLFYDRSKLWDFEIYDLTELDADYAVFYSKITNTVILQKDNKVIKVVYLFSNEADKEIHDKEIIKIIYEHFC